MVDKMTEYTTECDLKYCMETNPNLKEVIWIPCSERLPEERQPVLVYGDLAFIVDFPQMAVAYLKRGISAEEREELKAKGDIRARTYKAEDEHGNNKVPYIWKTYGPCEYWGQDVIAWMPLPDPYKGE